MLRLRSKKVLAGALAGLAVAGGGGVALAASQGDPSSPSAFLDAVAQHLGISSQELEDATKAAAIDQVDAALADGRITKAQAEELKQQIEAGEAPFFGPGPFFGGFRHGHPPFADRLSTAAEYLGLSEAELAAELEDGRSLAEVAKAEGKSVDGLEEALVADAEKKLDDAVEDGELTAAEAKEVLVDLRERIHDLVNAELARPPRFHRFERGPLPPPLRGWGA